jgi:hypothetical protein
MRTTLTLDDDLVPRLKELAQRRRMTFKALVNALLRRGLSGPERRRREEPPFRVDTFRSGFRPGVDPLRLNQLVDDVDAGRFGGTR